MSFTQIPYGYVCLYLNHLLLSWFILNVLFVCFDKSSRNQHQNISYDQVPEVCEVTLTHLVKFVQTGTRGLSCNRKHLVKSTQTGVMFSTTQISRTSVKREGYFPKMIYKVTVFQLLYLWQNITFVLVEKIPHKICRSPKNNNNKETPKETLKSNSIRNFTSDNSGSQ